MPLDELGYVHLSGYVYGELEQGRGRVTVHRILATLSSALGDAVRHHRLAHDPARPTVLPRPAAGERRIWSPQEAARFLEYCHGADPLFADLIELIVGTGMRKGEALGLQWRDVDLERRVLFVRQSLSAVDNNRLSLAAPKTRSSKNWVAISDRVAAALEHRAGERAPGTGGRPGAGYVFAQPDGRPLYPSYVLRHFYTLCDRAGVVRCGIHDLRHLAATISITGGVPLTVVSKTLRHSTLSTTANVYAHLTAQAARQAVDIIDSTLTQAGCDHHATTSRTRQRNEMAGQRRNPRRRHPRHPGDATTMHATTSPTVTKEAAPPLRRNGLSPATSRSG